MTLLQHSLTELLATALAIFLGDSVIANELLPLTKGHAMGFGWIATAFGFAFGIAIIAFGYASAHLNPAMSLALFIIGRISFEEFISISAAQMIGGFIGAVAMYIVYLPHFTTIPEPEPSHVESPLLRTRDTVDTAALRLASYSTKTSPSATLSLNDSINQLRYYLASDSRSPDTIFKLAASGTLDLAGFNHKNNDHEQPIPNIAILGSEQSNNTITGDNHPRRHSIQVADLQRRLRLLENYINTPILQHQPSPVMQHQEHCDSLSVTDRDDALHKAAVLADQTIKLSVFCNRPAIYLPIHNCLVELICTCVLILGALLIDDRFSELDTGIVKNMVHVSVGPYLVAVFIMTCILCLGGPTGFTANPARDVGPRLAHWLLPIKGKGKSEWNYSGWVNLGCVCGGAIGAGLFLLIKRIHDL